MRLQRHFHFCCARPEGSQAFLCTTFEIFEHLSQLPGGSSGLEPQNSVDDIDGPALSVA